MTRESRGSFAPWLESSTEETRYWSSVRWPLLPKKPKDCCRLLNSSSHLGSEVRSVTLLYDHPDGRIERLLRCWRNFVRPIGLGWRELWSEGREGRPRLLPPSSSLLPFLWYFDTSSRRSREARFAGRMEDRHVGVVPVAILRWRATSLVARARETRRRSM
jgi:hypothetical protein